MRSRFIQRTVRAKPCLCLAFPRCLTPVTQLLMTSSFVGGGRGFLCQVKCHWWGGDELTCGHVARHSSLSRWINSSCWGDLLWLSLAGYARPVLSHRHLPLQRNDSPAVAVKHCSPGLPRQHPTFLVRGGDVDESYLIRFPDQPHKQSAVLFVNR